MGIGTVAGATGVHVGRGVGTGDPKRGSVGNGVGDGRGVSDGVFAGIVGELPSGLLVALGSPARPAGIVSQAARKATKIIAKRR